MQRTAKLLALTATIGTMAIAALPSTSQADPPGSFSTVCSAFGLPSSSMPVNLGSLGHLTITTCTAAVLGNDGCPVDTIPIHTSVPGLLNLGGNLCLGL